MAHSKRQAGEEIEITPEMVEAGVAVLVEELADDLPQHCAALDAVVAKVFLAMQGSHKSDQ